VTTLAGVEARAATGPTAGSRVVMYVLNDCRTDVRVLREAKTLADAGFDVTVVARPTDITAMVGDSEQRDGFRIERVPISIRPARQLILALLRSPGHLAPAVTMWLRRPGGGSARGRLESAMVAAVAVLSIPITVSFFVLAVGFRSAARRSATLAGLARGLGVVARWRLSYLAWARSAALAGGRAEVHHGHDLRGVAAACLARRQFGGRLVYDSHEYFTETGGMARQQRWAKRYVARLERRFAGGGDALVTVNATLASILNERLRLPRAVVVRNCPPRQEPAAGRPERLRSALGLAAGDPLVLYHGGFLADRGLPEAIAAMAEPGLGTAHLALLGWGEEEDRLRRLAEAPALAGRVHLLPAVPPAELLEWVASADVSIMVNQPRTLNERLSTPNKLFESLAAGVPVVSSDFPERRRIVIDDPDGPLGAVCDPTDPAAIADALRSILGLEPVAAADLRARCARAARERYSWESQVPALLAAYRAATGRDW
jgi:glycosyltransferase involved in cell wall biosynthesis